MSLLDDIVSLDHLRNEPMAVVKKARASGRPIVVTSRGKPDVVVMDAAAFDQKLKVANLGKLLAEAEADVAAGRTRPFRQFLTEFRRGQRVSR